MENKIEKEIITKPTSIKVFCNLDNETQTQVDALTKMHCLDQSQIRIMADAHKGVDVCIGFSAILKSDAKTIDPRIVSNDIGCGVSIFKLKDFRLRTGNPYLGIKSTLQYVDTFIKGSQIDVQKRFGLAKFDNLLNLADQIPEIKRANEIVANFVKDKKITIEQAQHINETFATIGNGNHFIEMLQNDQQEYFLSMHSGSRALGGAINNFWMKRILEQEIEKIKIKNREKMLTLPLQDREKFMNKININPNKVQKSIKEFEVEINPYYADITLCKEWAKLSRIAALKIIMHEFKLDYELFCDVSHNFLDFYENRYIVRKGAVPSYAGEKVAIALNMAEGIVIGTGKGNQDYNYTAPHGAGRKYSRKQALQNHTMEEFIAVMEKNHVYSSTINIHTLDETPGAYKDSVDILKTLSDTIEDFYILKPIYNFKCEN